MKKKFFVTLFSVCLVLAISTTAFAVTPASAEGMKAQLGVYNNLTRERIEYSRKEDATYSFVGTLPNFSSTDPSGCAPVAAAIAMSFHDYTYEQLIVNHTAGKMVGGKLVLNPQSQGVTSAITALTTRMGGTTNGVTMDNIKKGITSYATTAGLKASYKDVVQKNYLLGILLSSKFNYSAYVSEIDAKHPVILGLSDYHVLNIGSASKVDEFTYVFPASKIKHAMVGFGYRTIKYYRMESETVWSPTWLNPFRTVTQTKEVNFRSETLLMVATGHDMVGYINIGRNFKADDAVGLAISK